MTRVRSKRKSTANSKLRRFVLSLKLYRLWRTSTQPKDAVSMLPKPIATMCAMGYMFEEIAAQMRLMGVDLAPSIWVAALQSIKTVRKLPKKLH